MAGDVGSMYLTPPLNVSRLTTQEVCTWPLPCAKGGRFAD